MINLNKNLFEIGSTKQNKHKILKWILHLIKGLVAVENIININVRAVHEWRPPVSKRGWGVWVHGTCENLEVKKVAKLLDVIYDQRLRLLTRFFFE